MSPVPPALRRMAAAGLAAAALSLAADLVLVAVGRAVFTVPASFGKFAFGTYALLTVLGVAGATAAWWAVTRLSSRPRWLLTRLAALVTALLLIPDFLLLGTPGNPVGPVVILMLMHLAIAAITYLALIKVAPAAAVLDERDPRARGALGQGERTADRCHRPGTAGAGLRRTG